MANGEDIKVKEDANGEDEDENENDIVTDSSTSFELISKTGIQRIYVGDDAAELSSDLLSSITAALPPEDLKAFDAQLSLYKRMEALSSADTSSSSLASIYRAAMGDFLSTQIGNRRLALELHSHSRKGPIDPIVQNYSFALLSVYDYPDIWSDAAQDPAVLCNLLSNLNRTICGLQLSTGPYRTTNVRAGRSRFVDHRQVASEMSRFVVDLSRTLMRDSTVHVVVKAAYAAFRLCCIHPFRDGNGRTSRLLAQLVLEEVDLPFPLHQCVGKGRREYSSAMKEHSPAALARALLARLMECWRDWQTLLAERLTGTVDPLPPPPPLSPLPPFPPPPPLEEGKKDPAQGVGEGVVKEEGKGGGGGGGREEDIASESARDWRISCERMRSDSCAICFEGESNLSLLCCGRPFHLHCISQWAATSSARRGARQCINCPQCRSEVDMNGLTIRIRRDGVDSSSSDNSSTEEEEEEEEDDTVSEESEDEEEDDDDDDTEDVDETIEDDPICIYCSNKRSLQCENNSCGVCCGDHPHHSWCERHQR